MRKVLFVLLVAASVMPSVVYGSVIGTWAKDNGVAGDDRWTLTVTPNAGETMIGFDVAVFDTNSYTPFVGTAAAFGANADSSTHFLLRSSHGLGVADLAVATSGVDGGALYGAFSITAETGATYPNGWTSALNLLQIVVPTGTYGAPTAANGWLPVGLSAANDDASNVAEYTTVVNSVISAYPIVFTGTQSPEPGTLVLLATGLLGMVAYAWRKRK